jgi:ribosomal protein L5
MVSSNFFFKFKNILRIKENKIYNTTLYALTIFPYANIMLQTVVKKIILNFGFKEINFNKKKAVPFFFAAELLTNQKCVATLSSKNVLL